MTSDRWERLKEILADAMDKQDPERESFVAAACTGDPDLFKEAHRILTSHDCAGDFLSDPAITLSIDDESPPLFTLEQVIAGRFRIVRFIARGGMGEVYEAEDMTLATKVALKTIQERITGNAALELFKQEILSARRVTHPNVCRIYDIAEHGTPAVLFLTMELLEGPTLSRYLKDHGPLSRSEALPVVEQIVAGLQAAHDAGVIHRDFKPGNVILTQGLHGWRPVITDFGLALPAGSAAEQTAHRGGTPGYMAPEQLQGDPVTPATDVYALGVVIGHMIGHLTRAPGSKDSSLPAGRPPETADKPPYPGLWKRVIDRCLQRDPAKRYQRPADVATALWRYSVLLPRSVMALAASLALVLASLWLSVRAPRDKHMIDQLVWDDLVFNYGSVSPDGRYLAFTSRSGDLAIRDLRSGTSRLLTHKPGGWSGSRDQASNAIVSPDNRQVAYRWNIGGTPRSELRIMLLASGEATARVLLRSEDDGSAQPFAWTPDGKNLLAARTLPDGTNQIAWVSATNGSVRVLKSVEVPPAWMSLSPDGRYIAYDGGAKGATRDIFVLEADGSHESIAVQNPANDYGAIWSSNGSRIVFSSDRTGSRSLWAVRIDHGKASGPEELVKAEFSRDFTPLGITRDGDYYFAARGIRNNVLVAEVNTEMTAAQTPEAATRQFVNSNFSASWSPDGQALAYMSRRGVDGRLGLVIQSWKTGSSHVIPVEMPLYDTPLIWFPDGRSVLVASRDPDGLYRVDLAKGDAQLVHRPAVAYYGLRREGKTVVYGMTDPVTKQWGGQLDRFDLDTGRLTTLKRTGVAGLRITSMAVSPDGKQLAYILENNKTQKNSLEVMPASGAESREIFRGPAQGYAQFSGVAWSPDQRYLLFVRGIPTQSKVEVSIWRASVTGGAAENTGITVHDAPDDSVLAFPSVHPDGRHIAYTKREPFTEVRVLENFLPKTAAP